MSRFTRAATALAGVEVLERRRIGDDRGYLERVYCTTELAPLLGERSVVQINHSFTARAGTVRGMHFQHAPHAELKIVVCLRGAVFDVAVDLRRDSATRLAWHGRELTADNGLALVIPEGCAHGFQALTDDAELLYLHTAAYQADAEGAANPLDPRLAIAWPLPITEMSARDRAHAPLPADFGLPRDAS